MRGATKFGAKVTKKVAITAGNTAGIVGENINFQPVNVVCDVITEQVEADDDVNLVQRAGLFVGTTLQGTSEFVPDEIGQGILVCIIISLNFIYYLFFQTLGVMLTAGHIIHDQSDADLDSTITERLVLGLGLLH